MKLYSVAVLAPLLAAPALLTPQIILPVLGGIAVAAAVVMAVSLAKPKPASFLKHVAGLNGSPELQLIGRALAARVDEIGKASGHALLDGMILKMIPGAAPLIPSINALTEGAETKWAARPVASAAPVSPAPASGASVVTFPAADHPVAVLLRQVLEAHQQQARAAAPAKAP